MDMIKLNKKIMLAINTPLGLHAKYRVCRT